MTHTSLSPFPILSTIRSASFLFIGDGDAAIPGTALVTGFSPRLPASRTEAANA